MYSESIGKICKRCFIPLDSDSTESPNDEYCFLCLLEMKWGSLEAYLEAMKYADNREV